MDRRVTVDLTMRVGQSLSDEDVAKIVEDAMKSQGPDHGLPIMSARVRRVSTEG